MSVLILVLTHCCKWRKDYVSDNLLCSERALIILTNVTSFTPKVVNWILLDENIRPGQALTNDMFAYI